MTLWSQWPPLRVSSQRQSLPACAGLQCGPGRAAVTAAAAGAADATGAVSTVRPPSAAVETTSMAIFLGTDVIDLPLSVIQQGLAGERSIDFRCSLPSAFG